MKKELRSVFQFIHETAQLVNELGGVLPEGREPQRKGKGGAPPKGYVLKAKESPLIRKALSAKRAELNLSLEIEPHLGDPIAIKANFSLRRGGQRDGNPGRTNHSPGGQNEQP